MLSHTLLLTFLIAMVPVLELRGAIPYGVAHGLTPLAALLTAVAGNLLPVPFLILFTRRVFAWLKTKRRVRRLIERLERRAAKKSHVVNQYAGLGLFILVAIPLPGTGAWTGALVAALMDMRMKRAMPAICLGVLAAGFIMTGVSFGFVHLLG